jgi:ABC-type branched-subunit amino acid transport system permease subunit
LRLSSYYLAVATLFLTYMATEIILQFDDVTGGPTGIGVPLPQMPGVHLSTDRDVYYLTVAGLVIVAGIVAFLVRSRLGRLWVALRDAPNAAAASGVRVSRRKIAAFAVSAAIAGVGGALIAVTLSHVGPTDFELHWSIMLILAVIVGGSGSVPGALFGAALVVLVPEALAHTRGMSDLVLGVVLMAVMIGLPGGMPALAERLRGIGRRGRGQPGPRPESTGGAHDRSPSRDQPTAVSEEVVDHA